MPRLRSLLFVPGDRPDRMEKALASGADALILDLEDAVAPSAKPAARAAIADFLGKVRDVTLFVRINPLDSGLAEADLAAVLPARPDGIVLPKAEGGATLAALDARLDAAFEVVPAILAAGVTHLQLPIWRYVKSLDDVGPLVAAVPQRLDAQ